MKKILFSLSVLLLLCGCSSRLVCTYKETYDDIKIKNKITFDFKNKEYTQVDTMTFKSKDDAQKYYDDIEEYKEEYNLVLKNNKIVSEIEDKLSLTGNKKEIKMQYESYGYKCR